MYSIGEIVNYTTTKWQYLNGCMIPSENKVGIIEDVFENLSGDEYCYWIVGEKELILHSQILGVA